MDRKRIYLASPTMHEEEMQYIKEAFDRNWVAPLGFNCDGFEDEMSDYLVKRCSVDIDRSRVNTLALSSGTAALHLSARLIGLKPGDVALCSDLTFAATVNPVRYEGATQVFIDGERDSWNMDPAALKKAFEKYPNARAVVLAHLYGTPSKIDEIMEICKEHNAVFIEDAAEALSATYKGRACGTFGELAALSFNGNKIITTSGGGMLIAQDKKLRDKALFLSTQAREPAPWYQHEEIGYNYRMSNVVAGIGRGQLLHLNEHRDAKEHIYNRYKKAFEGMKASMNPYLPDTVPNFWLSCLLLDEDIAGKAENGGVAPMVNKIMKALAAENIESRPIWKPMHMQPIYRDCDFITVEDKPVDEGVFGRGICLPSDIKMTDEEQDMIIDIVKDAIH